MLNKAMLNKPMLHPALSLTDAMLKIFLRDRQAIFFSLFFPALFLTVFALAEGREAEAVDLGLVDNSGAPVVRELVALLGENPLFQMQEGDEQTLRQGLLSGDITMMLVLPESFRDARTPAELRLLADASQVRRLNTIRPVLEQTLLRIERELRGTEALFSLEMEDVKARSQRYLDFLLPGLLALFVMQLAVGGSGFNLVEYRRKGILRRLFVTPLRPRDFIFAISTSRMLLCLMQMTVILLIAVWLMDIIILGDYFSLYVVIVVGTTIFLCLGFFLGSLASSQQSIQALGNLVIFPQMLLSGIFYPLDALPGLIQPLAQALPLTFVATGLRDIATDGASLLGIWPELLGMAVWLVIAFGLATRFFVWKEVAR